MAHPQNSFRGLFAKSRIDIGSQQLTANSTAFLMNGGVRLSGQANAIITGDSTGVVLNAGAKISNKANAVITGDSTGVVLNAGAKISNKANAVITGNSTGLVVVGAIGPGAGDRYINANTTAYTFTAESALPGSVDGGVAMTFISNSTGVAVGVNTTGTTWKYLNVTTKQPT